MTDSLPPNAKPAAVCGALCDKGSECLLPMAHEGAHAQGAHGIAGCGECIECEQRNAVFAETRAEKAERELARLRSDLDAARLKWSELQHDAHRWAHAATIQQQEIDRLRARLPSEVELEAFRFVCGREWPWDVDDYKDAAESWLARQENDNAD